jgi:hypothetical protein
MTSTDNPFIRAASGMLAVMGPAVAANMSCKILPSTSAILDAYG